MQEVSIQALRAALPKLPNKDHGFANSLISWAEGDPLRRKPGRPWSDKQRFYAGKLIEKANTPARKAVEIGNFAGIKAIFDRAAQHLKRPAVVLALPHTSIKIKPTGGNTRYPGQLHVVQAGAPYGEATYYGRITQEGTYIARTVDPAVEELLKAFAEKPADVAAEHGRMTGNCCFCQRALTDERSTAVGYGPICADHYGLPWGVKPSNQGELV